MPLLRRGRRATRVAGLLTAGLVLSLTMTSTANASVSAVDGGAYGASVNVTTLLGLSVTVGPTPQVTLPSSGSSTPITDTVASVSALGLLSTGVLKVSTQGTPASGAVDSSATVANVNVPTVLSATAIGSTCHADSSGATGTTTLADAVIGGVAVTANPAPNTTITLAGLATVILNEQIQTGTSADPAITVNAIDIKLLPGLASLGSGSIIIGQSTCSVGDTIETPVGAIGGILLTGVLGVLFAVRQLRRRPAPAVSA
jgi:hypothetical protein